MKKLKWILLAAIIGLSGWGIFNQFFKVSQKTTVGKYTLALQFRGHQNIVQGLRFSPDGNLIASGSVDSTVKIWNRVDGKITKTLRHPQGITALDYSRDGKYIATTSYDGKVRLWKMPEGTLQWTYAGNSKTLWTVAISPDGKLVASGGEDALIRICKIEDGSLVRTMQGHELIIWTLQFSPDGKQIASGSFDKTLKFWNVSDGSLIRSINAHQEAIVALAYSHSGKLVATASDDKTTKLWDPLTGSLRETLSEGDEHVQAVAFSPDDHFLIAGGSDKNMIGEFLQEFTGDAHRNKGITMRLWDIEKGIVIQRFAEHGNDATDMEFSPDGKTIVSGSADQTVLVWSLSKDSFSEVPLRRK